MFFYKVVVYCVVILFAEVAIANKVTKKLLKNRDNDDDVKHMFAELLNTIVKMNEERMKAMEKMIRLQDYMLTKNRLKADDDDYDSLEEEEELASIENIRRQNDNKSKHN